MLTQINSLEELWKYKKPLLKAIQAAAINRLYEPNSGWESINQILQDCRNAGEGFDIDILCPAEQAIGIPSSEEYDVWTSPVGPEVHHLLYLWSMDALLELKEVIDLAPHIDYYWHLQNPI